MRSTVGNNIFELAVKRGLSGHALANRAQVTPSSINRLFSGQAQSLHPKTLARVAAVLGVTVDELRKEHPLGAVAPATEALHFPASATPAIVDTVPLFSLEQIRELIQANGDPLLVANVIPETSLPAPVRTFIGESIIAIRQIDRAMLPTFAPDDLLFFRGFEYGVHRAKMPSIRDGDIVLATVEDSGTPVIRRFLRDEGQSGWLIADNENWPGAKTIRAKKIIGVLAACLSLFRV